MNGDNVLRSEKRWRVLRSLYEDSAFDFDTLSLISGIAIHRLIKRSCEETWQVDVSNNYLEDKPPSSAMNSQQDLRTANAKTARQVSQFLQQMMDDQTKPPNENDDFDAQTKTKNVLAIAKGVLTIEEMIANLEKLTDASSLYPQDTLEFHSKLERQIAVLADTRGKNEISQDIGCL